jgi:hypothetical protein
MSSRVLRRASWSPYAAGAGLGLVATVSLAVFDKRLSGAGVYQHLSGYAGRVLDPGSVYFRYVVPTGLTFEVWLAIGTFCGAFVSALLGGQFRVRSMPDSQWAQVFGPSVVKRWLIVFAGTMLLEIAAGIAGGCTASLAVSGGAVLAPGAFLFMAAMFAGGIPAARLLYRKREGR